MLKAICVTVTAVLTASFAVSVQPAFGAAGGCEATGSGTSDNAWFVCAGTNGSARLPTPADSPHPTASDSAVTRATPAMSPATGTTLCTYSNLDTVDGTAPPAPRAGAGWWMFTYCGDSGQPGGWSWITAGAAGAVVVFASPAQLARQAYARLTPPAAMPDYNPRHRAGSPDGTVVGFTTWLWLDGQSLSARSASASAGPNRATVTAQPSAVSFDPGDGSAAVDCSGSGRAYDPTEPNAVSDCVHRYLRSSGAAPAGVFVLTARVTWTATWTGTAGTGGVLPALTVTAATPVRVDELQAVNE
jgi:hypothetical protein